MIDNKIFGQFNAAVDSFDFSLRKGTTGSYALEITASARGKRLGVRVIILETADLGVAINRAVRCINDVAREVAPGIRLTGEQVNSFAREGGITLKASKETPAPGIRAREVAPTGGHACPFPFCGPHCDLYEEEDEEEDFEQMVVDEVCEIVQDIEDSVNDLLDIIRGLLSR